MSETTDLLTEIGLYSLVVIFVVAVIAQVTTAVRGRM